jgi:peptide/nickel transport system substrate-binding protein
MARAEQNRVIRFVPYVDLAILDPVINTASQTRTHGYMVYDTLYGVDAQYRVLPQMVQGHTAENDHRLWRLTLREGLRFHDGQPVLARDAVASLRRWAKRDAYGSVLMAATDELSAPDDRTIQFRMNKPFYLVPDALAKISPSMACIMPERLALSDPTHPVSEIIGSGPFRFKPDERIPGSRNVYEKFAGYIPRDDPPSMTAGAKIVHVDRVEWTTIPDAATAAGALQSGEIDWLEAPNPDLLPMLRRDRGIHVEIKDRTGVMPVLRFNCLQPPFDNVSVRRAVLGAVCQSDFMSAYAGDPSLWHVKVGVFTPGTPMDSDAGLDKLFGPPDLAASQQALAKSGYAGQRVVVMDPTDHPVNTIMANVAADLMRKLGMNVDQQTMDAGTMFQRRNNREAVEKGGWSAFPSMIGGLDVFDPAVSFLARGDGASAWYGWPTSPEMERLRHAWFDTPDQALQKKICQQLQLQTFSDAPDIPLGQIFQPTAYRTIISNIPDGFAKFWEVEKSA